MRIAVVTTQCPFVVGGAELHARNLVLALQCAGHEAEIVTMPFKWYPPETVLDHMLAAGALDISEYNGVKIDLAIGLKFPAYLMEHPNKVLWVLHQHRQAYDLWDSGVSDLFNHPSGQLVRQAVIETDNRTFSSVKGLYANSANVAGRLARYNGVTAEPLYHPPPLAGRLSSAGLGDYLYYPSRLLSTKRQDLVLRGLAATANRSVRIVFSGAADNPAYGEDLRRLAHDLGVKDRVEWRGFVTEDEMIRLYENARAVVFTPSDEDLGYVALEAMLAGKPLITLTDSGEPATLIRHEVEGLVVAPDAEALGAALDRVTEDHTGAAAMGRAAGERYRRLDISWAHVIDTLTGGASGASVSLGVHAPEPAVPSIEAPGETVDAALGRLGFAAELNRNRSYYETHWPRFQASLAMLRQAAARPKRILEIGTSEPYPFTALMREIFPEADFTVVQQDPPGMGWTYRCGGKGQGGFDIRVAGLNVETTALPFDDGAFDLVVAMEVLEHFCIDPGFVFREARRVLGAEGALFVTTPNLGSLPAIARTLQGQTPYSFGLYVPWHGVYGRHNREFTPAEVAALGQYAGFETRMLETLDVYDQNDPPPSLVDYMRQNQFPLAHRGQNIFWLGQRQEADHLGPVPPSLFPFDPAIFSGRLTRVADGDRDHLVVRATNTGPQPWPDAAPGRIRLTIDRTDQEGMVSLDAQAIDLPATLDPGQSADVRLRIHRGEFGEGLWHEIGLFAAGVGALKEAGRANILRVFAKRLEPLD